MQKKKLILIGSSTGGPGHLEKIVSSLGADFSSTLIIAQHLDAVFLPSMIKHLDSICAVPITSAHEKEPLLPARVIFTYEDLSELYCDKDKSLYLTRSLRSSPYQPSVNTLFSSAARLSDEFEILACLLTGIGDDGATGMLELKNRSAHCIAESEASSIVYGMPKAALELNACSEVLHIDEIIAKIKDF